MNLYTFTKASFNCDKLLAEATTSLGFAPLYLTTNNDQVTFVFLISLSSGQQTSLSNAVTAHVAMGPSELAEQAIINARKFGNDLAALFAKENVVMGITAAGKTRAVTDYCHKLEHYMTTGSLYAAIEEINSMIADITLPLLSLSPFVTTARLNTYKAKIQTYLGI